MTYNGGVCGDLYKAVVYSDDDKLSATRTELSAITLKELKNEVDLFLYGELYFF